MAQFWQLITLLSFINYASLASNSSTQEPVTRSNRVVPKALEMRIKRQVYRPRTDETSLALAQGALVYENNYWNVQYTAFVEIGSPAQNVSVCLDTGSSDLWIDGLFHTHSSTRKCPSAGCNKHAEIKYSEGDVKGVVRTDRLSFGTGFTFNTELLLAKTITSLDTREFQGVLGLAFSKLSHTGTTVLHRLGNVIDVYSFYLCDIAEDSWFVLGEPRAEWSVPGSFTYSPVVVEEWWTFEGALAVGKTLLIEKSLFALDTGTSYITVPEDDYQTMIDHVLKPTLQKECLWDSGSGVWSCPCSVCHKMNITYMLLNGKAFPVFPEDLMEPSFGLWCTLQIQKSSNTLPWILGDTFLRTIVPVFDIKKKRIGMALRRDHKALLTETQEELRQSKHFNWRNPVLAPFYPSSTWDWTLLWWVIPLSILGGLCVGILLHDVWKAVAQKKQATAAAEAAVVVDTGSGSQSPYVQLA